MSAIDEVMQLPAALEEELCIPMDIAADAACDALGLPLLGGPSGRGWSFYSTAQVCPHLWSETYKPGSDMREKTKPAEPLQVGGLYHLLQALYYAYGLGEGQALYHNRGLLAPSLVEQLDKGRRGRKPRREMVQIPNDAADQLLESLKASAERGIANDLARSLDGGEIIVPEPRPSMNFILQAERLFDAHSQFYGDGQEDVTPLALEWHAEHPLLGYTCRYDAIVRLGEHDPFVRSGQLEAGAILIHERKSAKWLSEWAREGWFLDGEILGQLLLWEPSGCARLFGPLAGLVVDVATKEKTAKFERILVPKNPITVRAHERGVRWQNAEMHLWQASGFVPKRWISCWRFGKKCGLYEQCRADTAFDAGQDLEGFDGDA